MVLLRTLRSSPLNKQPEATPKTADPLDTSIEGQLLRCQLQYENMGISNEHFTELPRRLYIAKTAGLYDNEILARRQAQHRRKRRRTKKDNDRDATNKSLNNIFVDFFLPQLLLEGDTRINAKGNS
jgi:hypothetical protein